MTFCSRSDHITDVYVMFQSLELGNHRTTFYFELMTRKDFEICKITGYDQLR